MSTLVGPEGRLDFLDGEREKPLTGDELRQAQEDFPSWGMGFNLYKGIPTKTVWLDMFYSGPSGSGNSVNRALNDRFKGSVEPEFTAFFPGATAKSHQIGATGYKNYGGIRVELEVETESPITAGDVEHIRAAQQYLETTVFSDTDANHEPVTGGHEAGTRQLGHVGTSVIPG